MTDGDVSCECGEVFFLKCLAYEAHCGLYSDVIAVSNSDTGALLTSMLQGIQTKECHSGNVLGSGINPYNATGISRIIL